MLNIYNGRSIVGNVNNIDENMTSDYFTEPMIVIHSAVLMVEKRIKDIFQAKLLAQDFCYPSTSE